MFLLQLTHQGWKCCASYWNKPIWPEVLGDCGEETIWVIKQSSGLSPREKTRNTLAVLVQIFGQSAALTQNKDTSFTIYETLSIKFTSTWTQWAEMNLRANENTHTQTHTHTKAQNAGLTPPNTDKPTSLTQSLNTAACPLHQNQ